MHRISNIKLFGVLTEGNLAQNRSLQHFYCTIIETHQTAFVYAQIAGSNHGSVAGNLLVYTSLNKKCLDRTSITVIIGLPCTQLIVDQSLP